MNNILICDFQITGHHSEYISYLIDYLYDNQGYENHYYFLLHPDLSETFPTIAEKAGKCPNLELIYFSREELKKAIGRGLAHNSITQYKIVDQYAKKLSVHHILFLYFNSLQLALGLYRPKYTVSGILFAQYSRLTIHSLKDGVKYLRKKLQTWLFTRNKKISRIFILNDAESADSLNKRYKTNIFKMLPDPIPDICPLPDFDIYTYYGINRERSIFLHIGSMDGRKGAFDILDSISYIPENIQEKICLLFVGKGSEIFENKFTQMSCLYQKNSQVQVIRDNRFVENAMMKSLFEQCDCVLIPYKNPESSSGILGHAAAANKPVIGTEVGLLGELIKTNNLGYVIKNNQELANKIAFIVENSNFFSNKGYVQARSVNIFSNLLINGEKK
jgi:glycosyltransferase involved in cell wall biosynthesis